MSYICLDLWNKRVWVAVSQQGISFPKDVVQRVEIIKYLKKYLSENSGCETIVVWLPYDLYGKDSRQLDKTEKFIEKLKAFFPDKNIVWHDERFSSFDAWQDFWDHRDDVAAQRILDSYLTTLQK